MSGQFTSDCLSTCLCSHQQAVATEPRVTVIRVRVASPPRRLMTALRHFTRHRRTTIVPCASEDTRTAHQSLGLGRVRSSNALRRATDRLSSARHGSRTRRSQATSSLEPARATLRRTLQALSTQILSRTLLLGLTLTRLRHRHLAWPHTVARLSTLVAATRNASHLSPSTSSRSRSQLCRPIRSSSQSTGKSNLRASWSLLDFRDDPQHYFCFIRALVSLHKLLFSQTPPIASGGNYTLVPYGLSVFCVSIADPGGLYLKTLLSIMQFITCHLADEFYCVSSIVAARGRTCPLASFDRSTWLTLSNDATRTSTLNLFIG